MSYSLRESVIKTRGGRIKFRKTAGGSMYYHIGVWLAAGDDNERDAVSHVEYTLHPTFSPRQRASANRSNDFSITFWAWGAFEIAATVHFVDTERPAETLTHQLGIRLPEDTGSNYEQVERKDD